MKVKLLKKVRERFSITYYPLGTTICGNLHKEPLLIVYDKTNNYIIKKIDIKEELKNDEHPFMRYFLNLHDAKIVAYRELVWYIKKTFNKYGVRRNKLEKINYAKEQLLRDRQQAEFKLEQKLAEQNIWYNNGK